MVGTEFGVRCMFTYLKYFLLISPNVLFDAMMLRVDPLGRSKVGFNAPPGRQKEKGKKDLLNNAELS